MTRDKGLVVGGGILLGLVWFNALIMVNIGLMFLNARVSPAVPWFAVVALVICIVTSLWAEKRWRIGLRHPAGVAWGPIYLLAFTATAFGICVCILQGAAFGMVRAAELGPATTPQFQLAYAISLSLVSAILAEVGYRGIMQGRIHAALGPWATILLVSAINTAVHRWSAELLAQFIGYFVTLVGFGYVRWVSGSIWPPLAAHFFMNLLLAIVLLQWGPFPLGEMTGTQLAITAAVGAAMLIASIVIARGITPYRGAQHGY